LSTWRSDRGFSGSSGVQFFPAMAKLPVDGRFRDGTEVYFGTVSRA
jgi:hypothetical protein